MNRANLASMSVRQLVEEFIAIGLMQYEANVGNDVRKYNRLYDQMSAVIGELKGRSGDQRSALLPLYDYPNLQIQLAAARATLAIAPVRARHLIETIAASGDFTYAGDAGMCLSALDQGIFKPT